MTERPDIVKAYADKMTGLVRQIVQQGKESDEFRINEVELAAGVVRDAVTVFVHPALVAEAARAGRVMDAALQHVLTTLIKAFSDGVEY